MSHVSTIEMNENWNLDTLKFMCNFFEDSIFEFVENKKTYEWFGRHVGDYPIPKGFTIDDMGKCNHVIKVDGALYEIGVIERNGKVHLLWDFWHSGGLQKVLGSKAEKLKQSYTVASTVRNALKRRRYFKVSRKENYKEVIINL